MYVYPSHIGTYTNPYSMDVHEIIRRMEAEQKAILESLPSLPAQMAQDWYIPPLYPTGYIHDWVEREGEADDEDVEEVDEGEELDIQALKDTLGPDLTEAIKNLRNVGALEARSPTPRLHQLYAAARLIYLSRSPLKGGILGDTMGLGKTLSSLLVIQEDILAARVAGGQRMPNLIITKKSLVPSWHREIKNNLAADVRVLILTSKVCQPPPFERLERLNLTFYSQPSSASI